MHHRGRKQKPRICRAARCAGGNDGSKILTCGLQRALLFIFPALQNSSYQLCYPVRAESSVLWKEMMRGATRLGEQRTSVRKIFM